MSIDSYEASRKRSDEIRADLPEHPEKYTMLTGDRPTGRLHLGHYFGTIRERVALQDAGITTRIIIADYQVITDRDTTANIADNVRNMVVDYLACGIDPEKDHHLHALGGAGPDQLMLALPVARHRGGASAQPHGEGRADASGPRAHGPSAHLPRAPGVRHPVLQGKHRARGQGPDCRISSRRAR